VHPKASWVGLICRTYQHYTAASDCQTPRRRVYRWLEFDKWVLSFKGFISSSILVTGIDVCTITLREMWLWQKHQLRRSRLGQMPVPRSGCKSGASL